MEALRAFAENVGYKGDIMDGVVAECAGGAIEEIHWKGGLRNDINLDGTLPMGDLNMPKLRVLDLGSNSNLKGEREERAGRLCYQRMSEGRFPLNFILDLLNRFLRCGPAAASLIPHLPFFLFLFSGTLVTLPPPSMKEFNITNTGVKIDVAAIEWPANATALVVDRDGLACRTTDPDMSKEGATTSEIRIGCERSQVIGTSLAMSRNYI